MSQSQDLEDLLAREGHDDAEALMDWAAERAAQLVASVEGDEELGPLLASGGEAGEAPPPAETVATTSATPAPERPRPTRRREPSNAAPLPPIPVSQPAHPPDELDDDEIEELDDDELELLEEVEDDDADSDEHAQPVGPQSAPSYGPPDGNESVPAWKAALLSTQTGSDEEAAARVEEESAVTRLPEAPGDSPISARLEAEEDEISQHSVDLSDLDID